MKEYITYCKEFKEVDPNATIEEIKYFYDKECEREREREEREREREREEREREREEREREREERERQREERERERQREERERERQREERERQRQHELELAKLKEPQDSTILSVVAEMFGRDHSSEGRTSTFKKEIIEKQEIEITQPGYAKCQLTNEEHPSSNIGDPMKMVRAMHFHSLSNSVAMKCYGLEEGDVNNFRNGLLVCGALEKALQNDEVCFVKKHNQLVLKVLHKRGPALKRHGILDDKIQPSDKTFREMDGKPLHYIHEPYQRILGFHAYRSHIKAVAENWIDIEELYEFDEYHGSSEKEGETWKQILITLLDYEYESKVNRELEYPLTCALMKKKREDRKAEEKEKREKLKRKVDEVQSHLQECKGCKKINGDPICPCCRTPHPQAINVTCRICKCNFKAFSEESCGKCRRTS